MNETFNMDRRRLVAALCERSDGMSICVDFSGHSAGETFRAVFFDPDADPALAEIPLPDGLAIIARRVVLEILDEHEPHWAHGAGGFGELVLRASDSEAEFVYWQRGSDHHRTFCMPFAELVSA